MARRLRVLALMHADLVPPDSVEGLSEKEMAPWKTEFDVLRALRRLGHEAHPLGVSGDLGAIREAITTNRPDIAFNLLEEFDGIATYDQNVVSYLELLRIPYTGCNPRGLILARDKALSKEILAYHRIRVPDFAVIPRGRAARRPRRLAYPLFVKSLIEEASLGIAQASIVDSDARLEERVRFIHERVGTDALVERYIEGRELYVGVLGNQRLKVLPIWELLFARLPEDTPRIATRKVKWDIEYQKRMGITSREADLEPQLRQALIHTSKRVYRCLGITGYARVDFRLAPDGSFYVLEVNPNPQLAEGEDFAQSAASIGLDYRALISSILSLGLKRGPGLAPRG